MKIIPQNGMILVTYLGRGETTTAAGVIALERKALPNSMEVVPFKVLAIDTNNDDQNLIPGQIVMAQRHNVRPIEDDEKNEERSFIRWDDVIAIVEEENENAN